MPIHLICGPMFSGKTKTLIQILERLGGDNTLVIKHTADKRYDAGVDIVAHDGRKFKALGVNSLAEVSTSDETLRKYSSVAIDEGQFFESLYAFCETWSSWGKNIYVTAISTDLFMQPILEIAKLMAVSEKITKLQAPCGTCFNPANFNYRKTPFPSDVGADDPAFYLGGAESYDNACRRCCLKRLLYDRNSQRGLFEGEGFKKLNVPLTPFTLALNSYTTTAT